MNIILNKARQMNILIIEDEPLAAQRLEVLVTRLQPDAVIKAKIDSVKRSVQWLKNNTPDLILMDIHLADGISFKIFEQCEVKCPVIFTTSYDNYALKAFKVNSIDYILKPVDPEELHNALKKLAKLRVTPETFPHHAIMHKVSEVMKSLTKRHKERFVIKVGERLKSIAVGDILYFFSLEKATFARTGDGRQHILEFTLDQLEELLDPDRFFRVNRKYIVAMQAIREIVNFTNSRLKLELSTAGADDVIVARERVGEFKAWLDR